MKKYAVFSGRSTRQEYWSMSLAAFILFFVCGIGVGIVETDGNALGALLLLISVPGTLALIIPYWAVVVRRLHDIGWSGFVAIGLFLLGCIEGLNVIAFILFIIIGCIDSQRGTNQYGPSEKYPS